MLDYIGNILHNSSLLRHWSWKLSTAITYACYLLLGRAIVFCSVGARNHRCGWHGIFKLSRSRL